MAKTQSLPDAAAALRTALGVDDLRAQLADIQQRLDTRQGPEWFTLRLACDRKGATYNTVKSRPDLQPNRGKPDGTIGGRRVWHRTTVAKWLKELDS